MYSVDVLDAHEFDVIGEGISVEVKVYGFMECSFPLSAGAVFDAEGVVGYVFDDCFLFFPLLLHFVGPIL